MSIDLSAQGDITIGGDVVGRDKIINNIQSIVQRALTAAEEAEQDRALETKILAQGVSAFAQRLQARASEAADTGKGGPYKGHLEYRLSDAEIFFGRSKAIATVLGNLQRGPLTILHAESGAGKTSLLQAGISPRLIAAGHLPVYLRPYNVEPSLALKRVFLPDLSATPLLATAPLHDFLRQADGLLGEQCNLYIFLDQFEEFFTHLEEPARAEFIRELAECLNDEALKVRWVLSMRTEFFGNLANFRPRIRNPFENDFRLNRLTRAEAHEVVVEPAKRRSVTYEAGLVETILDDLGTGADEVPPPQIQLVCSVLYEELPAGSTQITRALYEAQGGAGGILRGHLDRVMQRDLPPEQAPIAQRVLEALISADGHRLIRSRNKLLVELNASGQPMTLTTLDAVLNQLVDSRLLRVHDVSSSAAQGYETTSGLSYELTHDYLLEQIKVDPAVQARKAAQELLDDETRNFERYGTLLSDDKLAILAPRRNEIVVTEPAKKLLDKSEAALRRRRGILRAGAGLVILLFVLGTFAAGIAIFAERNRASAVSLQFAAQTEAAQAEVRQEGAQSAEDLARQRQVTAEAAAAAAGVQATQAANAVATAAADQARAVAVAATALSRADAANAVVQNLYEKSGLVPVGHLPVQLTFDGQRLWVVNREDNTIQSIDPATGKAGDTVAVGQEPRAIAFDGKYLWVANTADNTVMAVDPATSHPEHVIEVENNPRALLVEGTRLWIANFEAHTVQVVDLNTYTLSPPSIPVGTNPIALAFDGNRVWVANYGGNSVMAIDPVTRLPGKTYPTPGPWSLAFDGRKLWVANYDAHTVTPIDLSQGFAGGAIPVGHNPIALRYDGKRVWVSSYGDNTVQALDPVTGVSGVPIPVGTLPDGMAFDGQRLWVTNRQNSTVQAIDPIAGDLLPARPVADSPNALAFDGRRLWIAYSSKSVVQSIERDTGKTISSLSFGRGPQALLFDGTRLWVMNQEDNTVQALEVAGNRIRSPIPVGRRPSALAFDGTRLWVANADDNTVMIVDAEAQTVVNTIPVGNAPSALVFDGRQMWVANKGDPSIQPIEASSLQPGQAIPVGGGPSALAFDGRRVWVANGDDDTIQSIDIATHVADPAIEVGNNPQALAFDGKLLWVANYWSNNVQAVDPDSRRAGTSIPVGIGPLTIVSDGTRLWIANRDANSIQSIVIR